MRSAYRAVYTQGKRLVPTPAALRLADHARAVVKLMNQITQEFELESAKDIRPVQFATGVTTLIYQLGGPLLRELRKEFPNADIGVTVGVTEPIVVALLDRRFDLGLISLPVSEEELKLIPLFDEELLVLRPSSKKARSSRVRAMQVSELAALPFLLYPKRSNIRRVIDEFSESSMCRRGSRRKQMTRRRSSGWWNPVLVAPSCRCTPCVTRVISLNSSASMVIL
jgi:DNA-binding transcriptional LysR family regulator